jgi:hypothetical protein
MYYTIYKITNIVNNKIYIGKHQTEDLDDGYMGSGLILGHAIKKYGIDKFFKEILYVFDSEEKMNNMEKEIVNKEFLLREDVYNLKEGGKGGFLTRPKMTKEKAKKISITMKKYYEKMPGTFTNKKHTEETKKKIGESNSKHQYGEKNSQYGTMWIHNKTEKINKKIKKEDINIWLNTGWEIGRKLKF